MIAADVIVDDVVNFAVSGYIKKSQTEDAKVENNLILVASFRRPPAQPMPGVPL